jgi:hypothetical protein
MGRRRYESEFMDRELTKSFPERNDSKIGRWSLLGMTVAGLGSNDVISSKALDRESAFEPNFAARMASRRLLPSIFY